MKKSKNWNLTHVELKKGKRLGKGKTVKSPKSAIKILYKEIKKYVKEAMFIICLDSEGHVLNICKIADGIRSHVYFELRDVFLPAIISNASSIVMVHNHLADKLNITDDDIIATEHAIEMGYKLGIPVHDHIVIAGNTGKYASVMPYIQTREIESR